MNEVTRKAAADLFKLDLALMSDEALAAPDMVEALRHRGYVKLPTEWYIADDGDGDPSIWRPNPLNEHAVHTCIGIRFMAGNGKIEKPVADWLWENIRKGES